MSNSTAWSVSSGPMIPSSSAPGQPLCWATALPSSCCAHAQVPPSTTKPSATKIATPVCNALCRIPIDSSPQSTRRSRSALDDGPPGVYAPPAENLVFPVSPEVDGGTLDPPPYLGCRTPLHREQ